MIRVLGIDDEPDLLLIMKHFLKRSIEVEFTGAKSASEALDILSTEKIDVIVSDFRMPDMNAYELLSTIRKRGIGTPFILFSASDEGELPSCAEHPQVDLVIRKRGEPPKLYSELSKAIVKLQSDRP